MMKIYTKTGDDGTTGLLGGNRVRKNDPRLDCYGTLDELNAWIGMAAAKAPEELRDKLRNVQAELFLVGSHLAAPKESPSTASLPPLDESLITRLEMEIDAADDQLTPLANFILPGGGDCAARLHLARTVCRRTERLLVAFSLDRPLDRVILTYINRLSDWLFVQARWANHHEGVADIPWVSRAK